MKSNRCILSCLLLLLAACASSGCGSDTVQRKLRAENATNIQKISNAYKLYANIHDSVGPASADEFKQFLKTNKMIGANLKIMGIDVEKVDSYFVSEADGEELVIRWGVPIKANIPLDPIAFDKTGVEGMRRIVLACDVVLEVSDDAKYERLLAGDVERSDAPARVFPGGIDDSTEDDEP